MQKTTTTRIVYLQDVRVAFRVRIPMAAFAGELSIHDFTIREKLQEGGWGRVYSAVHIATGREVAMKFFGNELGCNKSE